MLSCTHCSLVWTAVTDNSVPHRLTLMFIIDRGGYSTNQYILIEYRQ